MAKERSSNGFLDRLAGGGKAPKAPAAGQAGERAIAFPNAQAHEGLLERVLGARGAVDAKEARDDLAALADALTNLSQKTVVVMFAMGKLLTQVKELSTHGDFIPWVEVNCTFSRTTAYRYMQLYSRYRDEPRKALEDLSITEAYVEAGLKRLGAPEPEEKPRPKGELSYDIDEWKDWKKVFSKKPMSGVELARHRVVPYESGKLFVVREETGPLLACDLFMDMSIADASYQDAIQEVHHNVVMALEVFYAKVEELEEQGILARPFDSSRPAMAKRMRNVTPGTDSGKKSKRGEAEAPAKRRRAS